MAKIGIIGAGSWGIALSVLLHNNGHEITVWSILEDEINMLKTEHEHKDKLPGLNYRKIWYLQHLYRRQLKARIF